MMFMSLLLFVRVSVVIVCMVWSAFIIVEKKKQRRLKMEKYIWRKEEEEKHIL